MATKLVLSRKSEWLNRARSFKVLVDGIEVGKINAAKVEEFELSQINQTIECKVDWCFSNKYEVNNTDGEVLYLQVKSGMKYYWIVYCLILGYFLLNFVAPGFIYSLGILGVILRIVVLGFPLLYLIYYFTIGRHQYLSLEKDTSNVFAS